MGKPEEIITQAEKDKYNTMSNQQLKSLQKVFTEMKSFKRASYVSRLIVRRKYEKANT